MNYEENPISTAFGEFEQTVAVKVASAKTVKVTAAHRVRRHTIMLSIVGALVAAMPVGAYAALSLGNQGPPVATAAPSTVVPSAPASALPSETPAPTVKREPITKDMFLRQPVPVPSWGKWNESCPSGVVELSGTLQEVVAVDLDGDGEQEAVVLLWCQSNTQSGVTRVLGYDVDETGRPTLLGPAITVSYKIGEIQYIHGIKAGKDGKSFIAKVANDVTTDGTPTIKQDREYAWDGTKFAQIGGPAKF